MFNFHETVKNKLYRCGSPSSSDIKYLSQNYGIKKVISLDLEAGSKINLSCALCEIEHFIFPIDVEKRITILPFLKNLSEIFALNVPTLIHCRLGKDRTGMAIAIYREVYEKWPCKKALAEALKYGFGSDLPEHIVKLFSDIVKEYCPNKKKEKEKDKYDENEASDSIVENSRLSAFDPYYGSASSNLSWVPFADYGVREWPFANVELRNPEQEFTTRQDYGLDDSEFVPKDQGFPQIGIFTDYGPTINGLGPSALSDWSV